MSRPSYICPQAPQGQPFLINDIDMICPFCGKPIAEHGQLNLMAQFVPLLENEKNEKP